MNIDTFLLIIVVFDVGYLMFYATLLFVATLVKYFRYLFNILRFCLIFIGFV